jgi:hypothetical protein
MSTHNLSRATTLLRGDGYFSPMEHANGGPGAPIALLTRVNFGAAIASADDNLLIDAATSTELPDAANPGETVTYTTAGDGSSPFDNADTPVVTTITTSTGASASVWPLDAPRNLISVATHNSAVVAMTILITGYDVWGQKMTELHTITAGTTSKTATGKKAFKYVESIAITAAEDASANTLKIGSGNVLGLPYALQNKADLVTLFVNGALSTMTTVAADATDPATNATGDVRGTVTPGTAPGGNAVVGWMYVANPSTEHGLRGLDQA